MLSTTQLINNIRPILVGLKCTCGHTVLNHDLRLKAYSIITLRGSCTLCYCKEASLQ